MHTLGEFALHTRCKDGTTYLNMFHYSIYYLHVFANEIGLAAWAFTPFNNPPMRRPSSMKFGTTFALLFRKNSNVSMTCL